MRGVGVVHDQRGAVLGEVGGHAGGAGLDVAVDVAAHHEVALGGVQRPEDRLARRVATDDLRHSDRVGVDALGQSLAGVDHRLGVHDLAAAAHVLDDDLVLLDADQVGVGVLALDLDQFELRLDEALQAGRGLAVVPRVLGRGERIAGLEPGKVHLSRHGGPRD